MKDLIGLSLFIGAIVLLVVFLPMVALFIGILYAIAIASSLVSR